MKPVIEDMELRAVLDFLRRAQEHLRWTYKGMEYFHSPLYQDFETAHDIVTDACYAVEEELGR